MDSFSPFERLSRSSSTLSPSACKSSFIPLLKRGISYAQSLPLFEKEGLDEICVGRRANNPLRHARGRNSVARKTRRISVYS